MDAEISSWALKKDSRAMVESSICQIGRKETTQKGLLMSVETQKKEEENVNVQICIYGSGKASGIGNARLSYEETPDRCLSYSSLQSAKTSCLNS